MMAYPIVWRWNCGGGTADFARFAWLVVWSLAFVERIAHAWDA